MNQKVQQSLKLGVQFLSKAQQINGSFKGQSSYLANIFSQSAGNDNVFFTALILQCLDGIGGAEAICGQAASYLLKQRTANWAWNYWAQGSASMQERAYPDDLDDTACAVSAILAHKPDLITAAGQANIARNLIKCEVQTGGPYITWLTANVEEPWADVDIAVNANIGHMLAGLGVQSSALEQYIMGCLQSGELSSPYYLGVVPTLYFLARWYNGPSVDILQKKIAEELTKSKSVLHTAMLVSSAIKQGVAGIELQPQIDFLISASQNGSWPAEALYFEPPENGQIRYAGSAELTTAFVLEALKHWADTKTTDLPQRDPSEIDDMAGVFARAGNWQIDGQVLELLNAANKFGWQAFTIYDDFLDDEGRPADLPQANKAHRQAVKLFKQAITGNQKFSNYVDEAFDTMDDANYWEVTQARDSSNLPDYGDYSQLAHRSWGQTIAPVGVMLAAGFNILDPKVLSMLKFLKHYIIAKQLSDDAHDWRDDLENCHMTSVVCMLLQGYDGDANMAGEYFWSHTILDVNQKIRHHLKIARTALAACDFNDDVVLKGWLARLESSCLKSEQGRASAIEFIHEFSRPALV